jgi:hypothetical protein
LGGEKNNSNWRLFGVIQQKKKPRGGGLTLCFERLGFGKAAKRLSTPQNGTTVFWFVLAGN